MHGELMGAQQRILQWIEETGITPDLVDVVMAKGEDEEGRDFIPTDEEREAAKTNKHSEFGTLFYEREQLERNELEAKLRAINEAGLDAQIEYLLPLLGAVGIVNELIDCESELDDEEVTRLYDEYVAREESLWTASIKSSLIKRSKATGQ